jgi:chromosome segregation protein
MVAEREELQTALGTTREAYNAVLVQIENLRREGREYQVSLDRNSGELHTLELTQTKDEEQRRSIRERIYNTYEIDLETPPENLPVPEPMEGDISDNIQMLKERLKRVGDVNMGSLDEYETENADLLKLVAQRDDLQTAVDDLDKAIKKLNREARVQFAATFEQVQKNFTQIFTTLFQGGEASLALEGSEDPLEANITINVRPAGKKMRGVTLLSGGERALTAISLLFSLYMVRPSAFCILDELDAPLDEANVDRFIRILREFSNNTQFIIVTHNKRTMEASDLLYGVTQQEAGVSTVAGLELRDSQQLKAA